MNSTTFLFVCTHVSRSTVTLKAGIKRGTGHLEITFVSTIDSLINTAFGRTARMNSSLRALDHIYNRRLPEYMCALNENADSQLIAICTARGRDR